MSTRQNDACYDDGLVHAHGWARDNARPAPRPASPSVAHILARHRGPAESMIAFRAGHDDGLVHSHGWAAGD